MLSFLLIGNFLFSQTASLSGKVTSNNKPLDFVNIHLQGTELGSTTDGSGVYRIEEIPFGTYRVIVSSIGYGSQTKTVALKAGDALVLNFGLIRENSELGEVVITGTMKEVSKLESPVPVEVYSAKFFKSDPVPSLFDALQHINGVRPQLNCNICNTGDIHINGLEGPYTMVMIDGMPIVSGLSTVYGLSGIPQSLVERVEVVKGPASALYGSEAVGGLINIITKQPFNAPLLSVDVFGTTWEEVNADIAAKFKVGQKVQTLLGLNYFNYQNPIDNNGDGFTDVTLQDRISIFSKWNFIRKDNRLFSLVGRYVYEDRWGGEMDWEKKYRGGNQVYGESIQTRRWEFFGNYQLPFGERLMLQFSLNGHEQNSAYGDSPFLAEQKIVFGQLTWSRELGSHDLLAGLTHRYTYYDDNTPATASFEDPGRNRPTHVNLPGLFLQDEISLDGNNMLLLGMRYDHNSIHGDILTPRINYKWSSKDRTNVLRLGFGSGYRVANVFTEDHAALTGAREVVFINELKPEKSWNANLNFVKKIYSDKGTFLSFDATAFYTNFNNKIIADYETDPNRIIYGNLEGYAVSQGLSLNVDAAFANGLNLTAGATAMDVYSKSEGQRSSQLFTEKFSGVWSLGYTFGKMGVKIDYTGNLYGPMRLPLLSDTDPRKEYSPWWSIQNIQFTKSFGNGMELYGGIKNLLNWTPNRGNPFIIARAGDPFDKNVQFDANGRAMATPDNPYGLTFDPSYVYGPNQGMRGFLGIRWNLDGSP